jgi:hypothetical protein
MTTRTKDAIVITILMLTGLAMIGDLHRIILRAVWPYVQMFWETYIAF